MTILSEVIEMKTVVVYESMYGNTHLVANEIADVADGFGDVVLVPASKAVPGTGRRGRECGRR